MSETGKRMGKFAPAQPEAEEPAARQQYATPVLELLGALADRTAHTDGGLGDGEFGSDVVG